jgi:hypothetical protein
MFSKLVCQMKRPLGRFLLPVLTGFLIFIFSQLVGERYELYQAVFMNRQIGLDLPVPWHLQTIAISLALILTVLCFCTVFKSKFQRISLILTLLVFFILFIPLSWLFLTSHGHLGIKTYRLLDFPSTPEQANTWVQEENIIPIPTDKGLYQYRFYFDRKKSEYVYEIWKEQDILISQRIYHFSRKCVQEESGKCAVVTVPYTPIDLGMIEKDYEKSIITSSSQLKDINGDGDIDLVVFEFSGNGDISQYRIFSFGKELKSTIRSAPAPKGS